MKLLKFPEEVKDIYLKHSNIMKSYIDKLINNAFSVKISTKGSLYLSSNVLEALSSLFNISADLYRPGYVKINFRTRSETLAIESRAEILTTRLNTGIVLNFQFSPGWYSNRSFVTRDLVDEVRLIDFSKYIRKLYYIEVDPRKLNLSYFSDWDTRTSYTSADEFVEKVAEEWREQKLYGKLLPALEIIAVIYESLKELKDSHTFLGCFLTQSMIAQLASYITWNFTMIPDTVPLIIEKDLSNVKDPVKRYSIAGIPEFILKLNIKSDN